MFEPRIPALIGQGVCQEDEQPDGKRRQIAQDIRVDLGRIARQFLEREE